MALPARDVPASKSRSWRESVIARFGYAARRQSKREMTNMS